MLFVYLIKIKAFGKNFSERFFTEKFTFYHFSFFIIKRCNVKIDELPFDIYLALSTLMIPLAIFIAQNKKIARDTAIDSSIFSDYGIKDVSNKDKIKPNKDVGEINIFD